MYEEARQPLGDPIPIPQGRTSAADARQLLNQKISSYLSLNVK